MKIFKTISLFSIALLFALLSTGCGSSSSTSTVNQITVWGFDDPDVFKPIIRDFQKEYAGTTINYVQKSLNSDYELDSLNAISAGKGPDVWTIPNTWVTRHADKLVPYKSVKAAKDSVSKVDPNSYFVPVVLNGAKVGDNLYGLTPSVDTLRIYYNPTLYEAAFADFQVRNKGNKEYIKEIKTIYDKGPLFWDDIIKLKQAFTGTPLIALGGANNVAEATDIYSLLMLQNKTKLFSDDKLTAIFNLPTKAATGEDVVTATKALDFYTSFANPASPNFSWAGNQPLDSDAFINNQVIMMVGYQSYTQFIAQRYPTFKYKMIPMPQITSSTNDDITDFASFNLLTVPWLTKNSTLSWNFIKYVSAVAQKTYNTSTKTISSATKKDDDQVVTNRQTDKPDSIQKFTAKTLDTTSRFPTKFDASFRDAIAKVNSGELTSQKALDIASDQITQMLRNTGY